MERPVSEFELDPAVIPFPNGDITITMDEWFASLRNDEPVSMNVSGAELVAEGRAESE